MEFILIIVVLLMIFCPSSRNGSDNERGSRGGNDRHNRKRDSDSFDPADTFHLEDGLDHETDDDGYCEECDDYHDYE